MSLEIKRYWLTRHPFPKTPLLTFTSTGDFSSSTYTAQITNLAIGGNTKNAYFLRSIGVTAKGTVMNFSNRFTLSGMTGQFSAAVLAGLKDVSGTAGPASVNNVLNPPAAAPAAPAVGDSAFAVPYTMQTGPIRYAPMASQAPTQITAKGNGRQYATSAYTIWSRSGMPGPDATQTVTQPWTYSYSSMEATVSTPNSRFRNWQNQLTHSRCHHNLRRTTCRSF